jgi:fucose permease
MSKVRLGNRARWALLGLFFLMGVSSMAWIPRIPEIKADLGLSDGQFGLMLALSSLGSVIGAQVSGSFVHKFGSKNVIRITQIVMPMGVLIMGSFLSVPGLMVGLFTMGFGYAAMDIAANSQAVVAEKFAGKKFLASLHGAWSIGTFGTALVGAALAALISPEANLIGMAIVAFAAFIPLTEQLLKKEHDEHIGAEGSKASMPWFGGKVGILWLFAFGALGSFVAEGAAMDWGGILLAEHMGVPFGLTASVFISFAAAMIISRFTADRFMEKHGAYATVTYIGTSGALAWASGIWVGILLHESQPIIAMIAINAGFFAAGLAIGPMFPAFIVGAANIDGVPPSLAIARIGVISIAGYFIGPSITGFISEITTLPAALMYPAAMLLFAGALGRVLKKN